MKKKTKIICTIWPATWTEEKLLELYGAGMNIVRCNFSHKDYEEKKVLADLVHKLNKSGQTNLTLAIDTKGPELRTGKLSEPLVYAKDEEFVITIDESQNGVDRKLYCDYPSLVEDISVGDIIKIESGLMDVVVLAKLDDKHIKVKALAGATIKSYRHVNLPGVKIKLPGFTDQDREDITFAIANNFDIVFMSFVRNADNLEEAREFLDTNGGKHMRIFSKIENQEWIDNIDEIIEYSDGVMVARWDLGVEVPLEKLPVYQHMIIKKCREAGKPVIMATQLMETMMKEPFPTRAEISDVYNSVIAGVDMIMTSGETALGDYPIRVIEYMTKIALEAETQISNGFEYESNDSENCDDCEDGCCGGSCGCCEEGCECGDCPDCQSAETSEESEEEYEKSMNEYIQTLIKDHRKTQIAKSAIALAEDLWAAAFICFTKRWFIAQQASNARPNMPIYAFTDKLDTVKWLNAVYGVEPVLFDFDTKNASMTAIKSLFDKLLLTEEDVVVLYSDSTKNEFHSPSVSVISVADCL